MTSTPPDAAAPNGELSALYAVARDHEAALLDDLALRAGLRWQCACRFFNPTRDLTCDGCGHPRPSA